MTEPTKDDLWKATGTWEAIEEIRRVLTLMNERFKSIERYMDREHESCFGTMAGFNERIGGLEQKVFPNMYPMLDKLKSVVGELEERYEKNPLDLRKNP